MTKEAPLYVSKSVQSKGGMQMKFNKSCFLVSLSCSLTLDNFTLCDVKTKPGHKWGLALQS